MYPAKDPLGNDRRHYSGWIGRIISKHNHMPFMHDGRTATVKKVDLHHKTGYPTFVLEETRVTVPCFKCKLVL